MQRTKRCQSSKKLNELSDFVPLAFYCSLVFLSNSHGGGLFRKGRLLERGVKYKLYVVHLRGGVYG